VETRAVEYAFEDTLFRSVLVYEAQPPARRPGLVLVPNWRGASDAAVARARAIAERGYVILVADVYGADVRPQDNAEAARAAGALYRDRGTLRRRVAKAVDVLIGEAERLPLRPGPIGAIGFCFGGAAVLELARSGAELAGVVSFHGNLATDRPAAPGAVRAPILVLNGAADPLVTAEQIQAFQNEMQGAGADWQLVQLAGAVHCFAEPDAAAPPNCVYHARSARRAYAYMDAFFAEHFGQ
jgi:dienelactone hydrolase